MKINQQAHAMQEIMQRQDTKNKSQNENFAKLFEKNVSHEDKITNDIKKLDVDKFLDKLVNLGAGNFWLNFNMEKIEDKIQAKKDELVKSLGLDKKDISEEKKDDALKKLQDMLDEYVKNMYKNMDQNQVLKYQNNKNSLLSDLLKI